MTEYKLDMARYDREAEAQANEARNNTDSTLPYYPTNIDNTERWRDEARQEREDALTRVEQSDVFTAGVTRIDDFGTLKNKGDSHVETISEVPEYPKGFSYLLDWWWDKIDNAESTWEKFGYFLGAGVPIVAFPPLIAVPILDAFVVTPLTYLFKRLTN